MRTRDWIMAGALLGLGAGLSAAWHAEEVREQEARQTAMGAQHHAGKPPPAEPRLLAVRGGGVAAPRLPAAESIAPRALDDSGADVAPPAESRRGNGIRTTGAPPGFERWYEPQTTLVDLYYAGRFVLSTLAEYTLETVTFHSPEEIVARIPQLRDAENLVEKLSRPLPANTDRVCVRPDQPLCGRLSPEDVGIIFDETRFRVDLFLHRDMLLRPERGEAVYLPPPDHQRVTLVQNLSVLHAASSRADDRYSVFGRTRLGRGSQHGFANWVSTDQRDISFDELGYRNDFQDHQLTVGLFEPRTDALRAMPRQPLLGIAFARSLKTRMDVDALIATPIELFLPTRSRVDIFRDGRLISSEFYEAGNQLIETARLPTGSYNVQLVITDAAGEVRVEEQLFIKSPLLAPPGEPQWFVEAGRVRSRARLDTFPRDLDTDLLRAGYRWRQAPWLGLGLAGASTGSQQLGEFSGSLLFDRLEAGGEVYASDEGGWGYGLRAVGRWAGFTVGANAQRTRADDHARNLDDPLAFHLLPRDQRFVSAQLSRRLGQGHLTLRATESQLADGSRRRSSSLQFNHVRPLGWRGSLQTRVEAGEVEGDLRGQLTLQWRNRRGRWQDTLRLAAIESELPGEASGVAAGIGTRWRDGDLLASDLDIGARLDMEPGGRRSAILDGDHRSHRGRGRAAVSAVDNRRDAQRTAYFSTVGYETSLVVGEQWRPVVGGPLPGEAAAILDLRDAPEGRFDVLVDGRRQLSTLGGRRVALALPPYQEYRVSLLDRGERLVNLDAEPRQFPLYPGNVVTRDWALTPLNILVGRVFHTAVVCPEGEPCREERRPLAGARLQGVQGQAVSDEEGFVQAEVSARVQRLTSRVDDESCTIDLSGYQAKNGVIRAPQLLCE
jgi:Mat/Ecp fimbriae outer membrane usher protein